MLFITHIANRLAQLLLSLSSQILHRNLSRWAVDPEAIDMQTMQNFANDRPQTEWPLMIEIN